MHYCILVITRKFPTVDVLDTAMRPFNEEDFYKKQEKDESTPRPVFKWDWWQLGGRYCAHLKIDVSGGNFAKYDLEIYAKERRVGRLFRSQLLENLRLRPGFLSNPSEEDALCYMGLRDEVIYADSARVEDCKSIPDAWGIVLPDGEAFCREFWDGDHWNKNADYDAQRAAAIEANKDCWISVVDIHD